MWPLPPRLRKALVLLLKLAVTVALLAWVVSGVRWGDYVVTHDGRVLTVLDQRDGAVRVDTEDGPQWLEAVRVERIEGRAVRPGFGRVLGRLRADLFAAAAVMILGQLTLMGVRWWYILRFESVAIGLGATVRLMFVGHFLNFFLPGSTGGDVMRAWLVTRRTDRRTVAVATVLLDRFSGLAGMAVLAAVMTLLTWQDPRTARASVAVGATVAVIAAVSLVLFSRRVGRLIRLDALIDRMPRSANLRLAVDTLRRLPRSPGTSLVVAAMTIGVHLLLAGGIACIGAAVGLRTEPHLYFLFVPVIYILAAVPISVGGLGVVEGMYVVFFAAPGDVANSAVLALALLARFTPMLLSLPGLLFWLLERGPDKQPASAAVESTSPSTSSADDPSA